jgi:elongation factor Ts
MNVENNLDKKAQLKIIADFRNATGYSLSDCKSVLEKTNFDMNAAKDILSKKYAEKYKMLADSSDIEAPEFVTKVFYNDEDGSYGYCTIRTKSDVVTRSEKIRDLMIKAFEGLSENEEEGNGFNRVSSNEGFKSMYDDILGYYREPIKFEKLKKKHLTKGEVFANYPHTVYHKQEGKKAYTVSKSSAPLVLKYEGELNDEGIEQIRKLAYAISMTIIGSNKAKVFSKEELDPKMIEEFKNAKTEEAKKLGKPEAAIEKIVSGQLNKFYAENLIVHLPLISTANTPWLKVGDDGDVTVEDAIKQTEKLLNCKISVSFYKVLTDK